MIRTFSAMVAVITLATAGLAASPPAQAAAGAIVDAAACSQNSLPPNDDSSAPMTSLPFEINFYGETYQSAWVNNNGNVTFDGPLRTYTPFGLVGTDAAIVAPFFADVDTSESGGGTVTYGWGETVYQGHRAFCASWLNVGYFSGNNDKRNSFQLLLVEREDSGAGAFDIVFNYDSIQWETGDASGGTGGLGGSPARAGFSNGSGIENASFEVPGSGQVGAFLDGSPTALNMRTTDGSNPGRLTWKVRGGNAPVAEYVALGDSYQSGEGVHDYWVGTDTADRNMCHRSVNAYPELLVRDGVISDRLSFWACSGSVIGHLSEAGLSTTGPVWDDPFRDVYNDTVPSSDGPGLSQLDRISPRTRLVTVGIGGNDMGFGPILAKCVEAKIKHDLAGEDQSCAENNEKLTEDRLDALVDGGKWTALFDDIKQRAPFARVLALGYPRFYDPDLPESTEECGDVRYADTLWINEVIRLVNKEIRNAAARRGVEYVDIYEASVGHELCAGADEDFLNAVEWRPGAVFDALPESYHPTAYGHRAIANKVSDSIRSAAPSTRVYPGGTYSFTTIIAAEGGRAAFTTSWPGSDVVMTLISPSGRIIDRTAAAPDIFHTVGPTSELYEVTDPEPGTWTVELFGAQVAADGEETVLNMYQEPAVNLAPTAQFTTNQSGSSVTVNAAPSTDPDGTITEYLWDFGDGTFGSGVEAQHTYQAPGEYLIALAVTDDSGNKGFGSGAGVIRPEERIAYSARGNGNTDIYSSNPDGTVVTQLTTDSALDTAPAWSPDRSKLAFASTRTGTSDIYTMNADGSEVTRITTGSAIEASPAWSPDGTKVAFSSTRTGSSDIYVMNADGTNPIRLTTGSAIEASPAWSPSGDKIAFSSTRSGNSDIYSMSADGTNLLRLTSTSAPDATPSWSPDGLAIAFTSITSLNADLFTLNLGDNVITRLTTNTGVDTMPAWSGDGSRLAYASSRNGKVDIHTINADGTNDARLTDSTKVFGTPSWR